MNKELEEAKEKIKDYIHSWIDNSTDEDGYTKYEIGEEEQEFFNAIEIALQALENSIPKQLVEEKIKEAQKEYNKLDEDVAKYINDSNKDLAKYYENREKIAVMQTISWAIGALEELLEGK